MDTLKQIYMDDEYKNGIESGKSASEIVPFIYKSLHPKSVVDVGGGIGTWLVPFIQIDNSIDVCCIDGDYVEEYYKLNLNTLVKRNLEDDIFIGRRFDLAISLEVAEHLTEKRSEGFVDDLTKLSDIIVFSAAVTYQPGDHHINCKESSFWKNLFAGKGYQRVDCIRPMVANNSNVMWWYKNNMFLYVKNTIYDDICARLCDNNITIWPEGVGDFVHYECFYNIVEMQKGLSTESVNKKVNLLLKWIDFNKDNSVDKWLNEKIKGGKSFSVFGLGDIGRKFVGEIQDKSNRNRLNSIIDNYMDIIQWMDKKVVTLQEFLNEKNGIKIIINTISTLDQETRNLIEDKDIQIIDLFDAFCQNKF